jgi:hypothetical protein
MIRTKVLAGVVMSGVMLMGAMGVSRLRRRRQPWWWNIRVMGMTGIGIGSSNSRLSNSRLSVTRLSETRIIGILRRLRRGNQSKTRGWGARRLGWEVAA